MLIGLGVFVLIMVAFMTYVYMFGGEQEPKVRGRSRCAPASRQGQASRQYRLEEAQRVREQQINEIRARVEREHEAKRAEAAAGAGGAAAMAGAGGASTAARLVVAPSPLRGAGAEPYVAFPASAGSSNARGPQYAGVAASHTRASHLSDFEPAATAGAAGSALPPAALDGDSPSAIEEGKESVFDTVWGARQSSGAAPLKASKTGGADAAAGDEDDGLTKFMPNMSDSVDGKDKDTNMALFTPERLKLSNRMSGHTGSGGELSEVDDFLEKQRDPSAGMKKLGRYSQLGQSQIQSIRDQYAADSGSAAEDVVVFNGSDHHYMRS
jgi:hypothetical protein